MMSNHELALKWKHVWGDKMSREQFVEFQKEVRENNLKSSEVLKEILNLVGIPIVGEVADFILQLEFMDLLEELTDELDITPNVLNEES